MPGLICQCILVVQTVVICVRTGQSVNQGIAVTAGLCQDSGAMDSGARIGLSAYAVSTGPVGSILMILCTSNDISI